MGLYDKPIFASCYSGGYLVSRLQVGVIRDWMAAHDTAMSICQSNGFDRYDLCFKPKANGTAPRVRIGRLITLKETSGDEENT
jgi:hypothetical protein